jgi:hypothetical protein
MKHFSKVVRAAIPEDVVVILLQARGPLDQVEGGAVVLSAAEAPIACPPSRSFAGVAVGVDRVVSACLALECVSVERVVAHRGCSGFGVWSGLCEWSGGQRVEALLDLLV